MKNKIKVRNIINKISGIFLNILLAIVTILIIIGVYYLIQIKILNNNYANIFGYTFFEVATGSMQDTIQIGDAVIVELTKDIKENDIIVYKEDDNFITHRLIKKEDNKLITKGDANNSEDKPIEESQVLGKVIYIIPKLGILRKAILSPQVLILITTLIILFGVALKITTNAEEKDE